MTRGRTLVALATLAAVFSVPAPADAALRLRPCDGVQCGRLVVPLDRANPAGPGVSLYVERRRALRRPSRGATLLLAGGPGQPATGAYNGVVTDDDYGEFTGLTPRNDVVAFDARGTGRSGLLRCPELERASLLDAGAEAAACARRLGRRRAFYRTQRFGRGHRGAARGPRRRTGDADRRLVRHVRGPGLRGALPGPGRARAAGLGARRVRLGSVLARHLPSGATRGAGGLPRRLRAVHPGPGGRPGSARRSHREARAARQPDAAERSRPARFADPPGALLHARVGRHRRDPARLGSGRGGVRPGRRRGSDPAPGGAREPGREHGNAARFQLGGLRGHGLRGDPVPVDALLRPGRPRRAGRRGRGGDPERAAPAVRPRDDSGERLHPDVPALAGGLARPDWRRARCPTCRC